jgi:hypothetical protein
MRRAGLLYLETIADFEKDCEYEGIQSGLCRTALDRWDSTFQGLEDRIEISLSESQAAGDKSFWRLLKAAKMSTELFLLNENMSLSVRTQQLAGQAYGDVLDEARNDMEALLAIYPLCRSYAHTTAVNGVYVTDGGCSAKLSSEVAASDKERKSEELAKKTDSSLPAKPDCKLQAKPDPELQAKCVPFASGSAAKVERGLEPVPPRECREVLAWLCDVADYDRLVRRHDTCSLPSFANDPEWCGAIPDKPLKHEETQADQDAKTVELCEKGVFDKAYCDAFNDKRAKAK